MFKATRFLVICSILFFSIDLHAQSNINIPFKSGEILRFKGSFFMSSLWADIAEVKIAVSDYNSGGQSLYSIQATASTFSNYDSFFKIRDVYQSWVDKNSVKPFIFKRVVDEGGYKFDMKYVIQRNNKIAKWEYQRKGNVKTAVIPITDNTHDLVSIMYYVRTIDFDKMPVNRSISIPTLIDDKVQNINLTYKGKENIKTEAFGSKACYKLGISVNNKALVNKESNNIWLTADNNRVPVQVRADIPVGSIQLRLVEAKGLK
jgi:hypothetical protein